MTSAVLPNVGEIFDRYRIDAELGSGGMGKVFRAFDGRLHRHVALKVLLRDGVEDGSTAGDEGLLREARAAAAFDHPGKVAVFDVGRFRDTPYIAMELVQGRSLRDFVGRSDVPFEVRVGWLLDVAAVLAAAHEIGLVHRDVKPENVMVRDAGGIKVLDFGIARRASSHTTPEGATVAASLPTMTEGGASKGTPLYMAPEQLRGEPLDGRVDQFAWATMAVELLTAVHPWAAGRSFTQALTAIVSDSEPVMAPGAMPPALEAVLRRALAKNPSWRFQSLGEARAAVSAAASPQSHTLLVAQPQLAVAIGAGTAPTVVAASPAPVGGPPQVTTGTAGAVVVAPPAPVRSRWPRRLAFTFGGIFALLALLYKLGEPPPLRPPQTGLNALQRYENPRGSDSLSLESAALWEAAARDFADAAEQYDAPPRWEAARAFSQGQVLLVQDRIDEGIVALEQAVRADAGWATPHLGLSGALARAGKTEQALSHAAEAERLAPDSWRAPYAAGAANAYAGRLEPAIEDYRRALAMAPDHPLVLSDLALAYHALRLDEEAKKLSLRALELDADALAPRILLAEVALEHGAAAEALGHATRALSVFPKSIPARLAQAEALALLSRLPEAAEALDAARQLIAVEKSGPYASRLGAVEARVEAAATAPSSPAVSAQAPVPTARPSPRVPVAKAPRSASPAARSPSTGKGTPDLGY